MLTLQGVKIMRRILGKVCMALFVPVLLASLLFAGCGSAESGDYEHEVAEINSLTSQKLEESLYLLNKEEHGEQEAQVEEEAHEERRPRKRKRGR